MKQWKKFYLAAWVIILVMFFVFLFASFVGAKKIYIKGINFMLPNPGAYELYRIDDTMAVEITKDGFLSVIGYEETKGLEALAGKYRVNGEEIFMVSADFQMGDFIYTNFPQSKTTIVNIKTGERLGKASEESDSYIDIGDLTEYQKRNLTADDKYHLTETQVKKQFEKLNTFHEGIYTIILAFLLITFIMIVIGISLIFGSVISNNRMKNQN